MDKYQCSRVVSASRIAVVLAHGLSPVAWEYLGCRLILEDGQEIEVGREWIHRYLPQAGGYLVTASPASPTPSGWEYLDAKVFERDYQPEHADAPAPGDRPTPTRRWGRS
jgi:hypothetical protein